MVRARSGGVGWSPPAVLLLPYFTPFDL